MRVRDVRPGHLFNDRGGATWARSDEEPQLGVILCVCVGLPSGWSERWPKLGSVWRADMNEDAMPAGST